MKLFRARKIRKAQEALVTDMKIIIPSAENFFAHYRQNIAKISSRLDAEKVLDVEEVERYKHLISNFDEIAAEALVNALIDTGYKKEDKKWKIKNLF